MNKILFKLIEGKGRFFLGRNWPVWNPEKCHTNLQCESESERSKEQFCGCWNEYNRAINECISEALKNGEIVNTVVIKRIFLYEADWYALKDGDTFDLPSAKGYLDGRNKGFNEALEEVKKVFSPVFQIAPSAENIIPIMEAFKKSFEEIEKLKR